MPIRALAALAVSTVCACNPSSGKLTEGNSSMNYQLSELDLHEFSGIRSLVAAVQGENVGYEIFDLDGNRIEIDMMEKRCGESAIIIAGYIIVNDGDPRVLKRYVIKDLCADILRPRKDFGFKNPYQ